MRTNGSEAFEHGFWASVDTSSHNCDPARRMLDPMVSYLHALRVMHVRVQWSSRKVTVAPTWVPRMKPDYSKSEYSERK